MATVASLNSYEYRSGSCTLRITGQLAALSQVAELPVLKRSRFQIQLLTIPEFNDLDDLSVDENPTSPFPPLEIEGRAAQLTELTIIVTNYVQQRLSIGRPSVVPISESNVGINQDGIALSPTGLTRHRLVLPESTLKASNSPVNLTTLQLCDLADALEQADRQLHILPDDALTAIRPVRPRLPLWIGSVAAVGIAAVLGSQWLMTSPTLLTGTSSNQTSEETLSQRQELATDSPDQISEAEPSVPPTGPGSTNQGPAASPEAAAGDATSPTSPTVETTPGQPTPQVGNQAEAPKPASTPAPTQSRQASPAVTPPEAEVAARATPPMADEPTPALAEPDYPAPAAGAPAEETGPAASPTTPDTTATDSSEPVSVASQPATGQRNGSATLSADPDASPNQWKASLATTLQQNWEPLPTVMTPLTYTVTIGENGIIQAVSPQSTTAAEYQNDVPLPVPGNNFPGFPDLQETTITVEFLPTGIVTVDGVPSFAAPPRSD
jgi:hypothetical protein